MESQPHWWQLSLPEMFHSNSGLSWYWRVANYPQMASQRVIQSIIPYLAFYSTISAHPASSPPSSNIGCLANSTVANLEDLVTCLDTYTVGEQAYDTETYAVAQPTSDERLAWTVAVRSLLDVDGNCTEVILSPALDGIYSVTLFAENTTSSSQDLQVAAIREPLEYCVLSEKRFQPDTGYYVRGWGFLAVPASRATIQKEIHFAAPHPIFDSFTPIQAAALFSRTRARSLLISGRMRRAFLESTDCIIPSPGNGPYWKTDPAHDINEPFFDAAKAIWDWQSENGGCPSASCAYIQMHGKGPTTCSTDDVFMSTGLGTGSSSIAWYKSPDDAPVKRLYQQLVLAFPSSTISLPSNDTGCGLTATTNVVGRLINGINPANGFEVANVCTKASNASLVTGQFVHLEQALHMRAAENYDTWANAVSAAFS
ncbi:hypothetical protein HGRIS_013619 [Hohenbuehelia grisea]|uniref:Uncharacterized protein n=1 Tax=Hohenbuehelia grisea TaxID=104357 RepID=A0ABR3IWC3_9AGAR